MKLTYIYHSGFILAGKEFSILFDYYRDTPEQTVLEHFLKRPGQLYVLASHAHPDHFNPVILDWKAERPDIRYIFSEDIRVAGLACYHNDVFLKKGEDWNDNTLKVQAFGSTDIGISFLLDIKDKRIFHAGDLNNWHWQEESTPEEIREAEEHYRQELNTLRQYTDYVDLALFPVDPRLGQDYMRGAQEFITCIHTHHFAPMHFWEKYEKANAFGPQVKAHNGEFIPITRPGESIELNF